MGKDVDYNPAAPETIEDPYPVYRRLRREHPVHRSRRLNASTGDGSRERAGSTRQGTGRRARPRDRQHHPGPFRERDRGGRARAHRAGSRALRLLEHRFPVAVVIEGEAARIRALLCERATGTPSVVVSSLPLRNLVEEERDTSMRESLDLLPRAGAVVQFTYARHPAISCERLEVECQRVGFARLNVPPAGAWRIRRGRGRAVRRGSE